MSDFRNLQVFLRHLRRICDRDAADLADSKRRRYLASVVNGSAGVIFDASGLDRLLAGKSGGIRAGYCTIKFSTAAQYWSAQRTLKIELARR